MNRPCPTRRRYVAPRQALMWILMPLLLMLGGGLSSLPAAEISVADYRQELISLDGALARHDHQAVIADRRLLSEIRILYGADRLDADPVLLAALDRPAVGRARHLIALQLSQLDRQTTAAGAPQAAIQSNSQALAAIAAQQRLAQVARDGDLGGPALHRVRLPDLLHRVLVAIGHGILHALRAIWHWLRSWFGDGTADDAGHGTSHMIILVVLVCVVIAIGFVVLALLNRSQAQAVLPGPAASQAAARDADPRSRASDEWRRYGDRLAAEGRWREAMRAWYHAVLVQCWTTGTIRHRVGWTNWEYAAHLPAGWSQRAAFVDLTARFDRHWYGNLGGPDDADAFKALSLTINDHLAGR